LFNDQKAFAFTYLRRVRSEHLSRQLDKQQPAQDNSCLAPIFLKIRTHALCPEKPPGSPELSLANFWSQVKEDTENNLEYSTRHANIRWSKVPIRNNRKRHSQANVLKIPPGTTTYSSQFDTFSEAFFLFFYDDIIIAIVTETNRKASDFGVTSIGRRKLDARKLIAATWTRDNWTRATITRVRQLDGGHMRQLDGGHMRHALKLFHNI
jgi:hypothetical protein